MKVLGYANYGNPDVFIEETMAIPKIEAEDVLIKTKYVSIHPVDTIIRSGGFSGGHDLNHFLVPGSEILGEVVELGAAVTAFKKGDVVIGKPVGGGGYAEYVKVPQSKVFDKPNQMPDRAAAGFSGVGNTAYYALFDFGHIQAGQTITILGASGGVGSIAIQIAKHEGLHVIAVASEKNKDYVLNLGADEFVDYRKPEQFNTIKNKADVVIDASLFASSSTIGIDLVKEGGRYVTLTSSPTAPADKNIQILDMRRTPDMTDQKAMDYLSALHDKTPLRVKPTALFPFSAQGVIDAHTALEEGSLSKKILLEVK